MNASSKVCSSSSSPFSYLHLMVHRQSKTSLRNQPSEKTLKEFHHIENCKHCRLLSSGFQFLDSQIKIEDSIRTGAPASYTSFLYWPIGDSTG